MKKRDLSDEEKELWKEFSKSTEPLPHQIQKTSPGKKKLINSVNLKDENRRTALMIAAQDGQTEVVEALIKAKADVDKGENRAVEAEAELMEIEERKLDEKIAKEQREEEKKKKEELELELKLIHKTLKELGN